MLSIEYVHKRVRFISDWSQFDSGCLFGGIDIFMTAIQYAKHFQKAFFLYFDWHFTWAVY